MRDLSIRITVRCLIFLSPDTKQTDLVQSRFNITNRIHIVLQRQCSNVLKVKRRLDISLNDSHTYHFENKSKQKIIWRCVIYEEKCCSIVHIVSELSNGYLIKIMDYSRVLDVIQMEVKIAIILLK